MKTKLLILVLISAAFAGSVSAQSASDQQQKIANEVVSAMVKVGFLRVDTDLRKAWIASVAWESTDAIGKESLTFTIAVYCHASNPTLDLYDKQSGRKLASYGPFQGFKVE
jgi:hypothetical protein